MPGAKEPRNGFTSGFDLIFSLASEVFVIFSQCIMNDTSCHMKVAQKTVHASERHAIVGCLAEIKTCEGDKFSFKIYYVPCFDIKTFIFVMFLT